MRAPRESYWTQHSSLLLFVDQTFPKATSFLVGELLKESNYLHNEQIVHRVDRAIQIKSCKNRQVVKKQDRQVVSKLTVNFEILLPAFWLLICTAPWVLNAPWRRRGGGTLCFTHILGFFPFFSSSETWGLLIFGVRK